jgi:hypothetical protein
MNSGVGISLLLVSGGAYLHWPARQEWRKSALAP